MWDFAIGGGARQLVKPMNRAKSVVFSPDGALLATSGWDIKLWNALTGEEVRHFVGNTEAANAIAFSPDGALLVSGGNDGEVQLWNVATGDEVHLLTGHSNNAYAVEFSPDSMHVATGSSDNSARLWNVATGEQVQVFLGHRGSVSSVRFSPDGKHVATGSWDGTVGLWNAATGDLEYWFTQHYPAWVNTVAFSPVNGARLASGAEDATIRIWDVPSRSQVLRLDEPDWIRAIEFFPDGTQLASASQSLEHDGRIILWNTDTGDEIRRLEGSGHTSVMNSVAFSPDGTLLASASDRNSGFIRLWDVATGEEVHLIDSNRFGARSVAFSPDGSYIIFGAGDRTVRALRVPRIVGVTEEGSPPLAILLEQNYPNPAKSNTIISFTLPESAYVRMEVFDILGRNVTLLMDPFEVAGRHDVNFRTSGYAEGSYFYRLSTGSTSITRQMHLLR